MYLGKDPEAGQSISEDVKRVITVSSPVVAVSWINSGCGAGGRQWEQGGILPGEVREHSARGALELVIKEKCFAQWKKGERQVRSESEGPYVSQRLGFILAIRRDLSSGWTRSPFSLRKGPLGEAIGWGRGVRRVGEADRIYSQGLELGVCVSLSHLSGVHLRSMIQRFQSQEHTCPLTGIYTDAAFSQRSHPRDPGLSGREPVGPPFLSSQRCGPSPGPWASSW